MDPEGFRRTYQGLLDEVKTVVLGQDRALHLLLTSVLAGGHAILTGVPGLGRTLIAESLGKVLGLTIGRIQFTPDLLPTDVTGTEVVQTVNGAHQYRFVKGPVFANLVLADEINRAPARTQSALLEAMQERQITVSGQRYPLDPPFLVIATQNTLDTEGVYPLPEAQLDRFMMLIEMKYSAREAEIGMLEATTSYHTRSVRTLASPETVLEMQRLARVIPVPASIKDFTASLVRKSRLEEGEARTDRAVERAGRPAARKWWGGLRKAPPPERVAQYLRWGASPRAGQALLRAAKVAALVKGRSYVAREDILEVAYPILAHRVVPDHRAGAKGLTSKEVVERLIQEVSDETAPKPLTARMRSLLLGTGS